MHSTALFSFNPETHVFASEASTLGMNRGVFGVIELQSAKTGATIKFSLRENLWQGFGEDREICGWKYTPMHPASLTPEQRKLTITVFNT